MRAAGDRRLKLERSLPRALQTGGLTLCYQPIVMTESGRPVGFEALMRWEHPTLGIIPPVEFIPVAESTRIIGDLTFWVIEQSLWNLVDWTARWPYAIPPYVSINVSRKQIGDALFLDQLRTLLRYTKLVPGELVVEITPPDRAATTVVPEIRLRPATFSVNFEAWGSRSRSTTLAPVIRRYGVCTSSRSTC